MFFFFLHLAAAISSENGQPIRLDMSLLVLRWLHFQDRNVGEGGVAEDGAKKSKAHLYPVHPVHRTTFDSNLIYQTLKLDI